MHQDVDGHAPHRAEGRQHPQRVRRREAEDVLPLRDDDERLQVHNDMFTSLLSRNLGPQILCRLITALQGRKEVGSCTFHVGGNMYKSLWLVPLI